MNEGWIRPNRRYVGHSYACFPIQNGHRGPFQTGGDKRRKRSLMKFISFINEIESYQWAMNQGNQGLEEFYGLGSRGWKSHNGSIVIVLPERSFWKCIVKMFNCKQRDVRNTFPPLHKIVPPLNFVEPDSTAHRKIEPNIEVFSKTLKWKIKKLR